MTDGVDPVLDSKRAEILDWATSPTRQTGKHTSSHINDNQHLAITMFRSNMDRKHQWSQVTYYDPRDPPKDSGIKKQFRDFDPNIDFILDETLECKIGNAIADNWLASVVAVGGNRAKLVLDAVKNIGRPQNFMGGLFDKLKGNEPESDQPEETPQLE